MFRMRQNMVQSDLAHQRKIIDAGAQIRVPLAEPQGELAAVAADIQHPPVAAGVSPLADRAGADSLPPGPGPPPTACDPAPLVVGAAVPPGV